VRFYDATDREGASATLEQTTRSVHAAVASLLEDEAGLRRLETSSIAFAREKMDVYRVLWTILQEQIL
jgi:hypothetical protein